VSIEELRRALVEHRGFTVSLLDLAVQVLVVVVLFGALVLGIGGGPFPAGDGTLTVTSLTHGLEYAPLVPGHQTTPQRSGLSQQIRGGEPDAGRSLVDRGSRSER
jgi:hypothetical protein